MQKTNIRREVTCIAGGVISLEYLGFFLFLDIRSIEQSRIQSQVASDGDEGASKISKRDNHIMLATSLMPTKQLCLA